MYFGGPVQTERGFVLHEQAPSADASAGYNSTLTIPGGLEMTTSKDVLGGAVQRRRPEARAGHARLQRLGRRPARGRDRPQRLAQRSDADPAIIFDTPIEQRYERALSLLGFDPRMLSPGGGARMSVGRCACAADRWRVPPQLRSFLAFDFGTRRVGVASGNSLPRTRARRCDDRAREGEARFAAIERADRASGSPTRWWSACPSIPTARRTTTRGARSASRRQLHGALPPAGARGRRALQHHRGAGRRRARRSTPPRRRSSSSSSCSEPCRMSAH